MYKKIIIHLALIMIASHALADTNAALEEQAALAAAADTSFYIETPMQAKLTVFHKDASGKMSASTQVTVPENSILAVNLTTFNDSADDQWVCGIRIVDVQDEDLRESDALEETNYCVPAESVKKAGLLETSNGKNIEAFLNYQKTGHLNELHELGNKAAEDKKNKTKIMKIDGNSGTSFISPLKNCDMSCIQITSDYGMRIHPVHKTKRLHKGTDLRAATGSQVVSVLDGKVLATRTEKNLKTGKMKGYGHYVIVIHPQRQIETLYAHLSAFKTSASKVVARGQTIALSGNTGVGTGAHLHFEIHTKKNGVYTPVNPRTYISKLMGISL